MELHHASKTFRAAPVARSQPVEFGFHKTLITFKTLMTPNHEILSNDGIPCPSWAYEKDSFFLCCISFPILTSKHSQGQLVSEEAT